jgi:hypothetical protein
MRRFTRTTLTTWLLAFGVVACGDSATEPEPAEPTALSIVSGDAQTLDTGETSAALTIRVLDQNSAPMSGVTVTFEGSGVAHTLSQQSVATDASGEASVTVTAGSAEGAITVEASVTGLTPVVFTATVDQVLVATTISVVSGDAQDLDFNEVSAALVVEVLDQNDDPMEGLTVTFTGSGVSHSLSAGSAVTGANGQAQVTVTAGIVDGAITIEASTASLIPASFGLTVLDAPYSVTAPANLRGITFDGTWLWGVGGPDVSPIIYQISAVDGSVESQFAAPAADHRGLTFDGTNIWYSSDATERIYRIPASTGVSDFSFASPGADPRGLAWDGATLWHNDSEGAGGTVYQLDPSDGSVLDQFTAPVTDPLGLTWDGTHLWTAQLAGAVANMTLVRFTSAGAFVSELPNPGTTQIGLAFDSAGPWLWSADPDEGVIHRLKVTP